jgi:hypothetical protein
MIDNFAALWLSEGLSTNDTDEKFLRGIEYRISNKCYLYPSDKEITAFYQLRDVLDINSAYVFISGLLSIPENQTSFKGIGARSLASDYLDIVANGARLGYFDLTVFKKLAGPTMIKMMTERKTTLRTSPINAMTMVFNQNNPSG